MWSQTYYLFGNNLGLSALIAAVPIFTLLFLLGILRKPAWIAGLAGLAISLVLAVAGYHMPLPLALSSAAHGAAFGLFPISWIVFWAIALFRLTVVIIGAITTVVLCSSPSPSEPSSREPPDSEHQSPSQPQCSPASASHRCAPQPSAC